MGYGFAPDCDSLVLVADPRNIAKRGEEGAVTPNPVVECTRWYQ